MNRPSTNSQNQRALSEMLIGEQAAKLGGARISIELPGDNHYQFQFNDELADNLAPKALLFRRSTVPVIPWDGRLVTMSPENFVPWVTRYVAPYRVRYDRDGMPQNVYKDMTATHARQTLSSLDFVTRLPAIERLYPCPIPVIDGNSTLHLVTPGYNPSTCTYVFNSDLTPTYTADVNSPHNSEGYYDDTLSLHDAVRDLYEIHREIPFSDWTELHLPSEDSPFYNYDLDVQKPYKTARGLACHIAAMLSIFAGQTVPRLASRMGFIYNADQQRSGKTLCVKIATIPVYGTFNAQSWTEDDDTMKKLLDAEVLTATPYICFDNVRVPRIASQALEGFMTSPSWTGRILSKSEMFTAENNATIFITGNNIDAGTDMQHRCLWIDLHVPDADIQAREIEGEIIDDAWLAEPANRRRILNALWSIVRHWDAAGRPLATGRTYQGFDRWCKIIGGMVEFAGFGDMLARPALEGAGDTEKADIHALVVVLYDLKNYADQDFTHQEVIHYAHNHGLLPWVIFGKEDYHPLREGTEGTQTLILDPRNHSKVGQLFQRHCHGERGGIFSITTKDGQKKKVRFYSTGKGKYRRYHVIDVPPVTPTTKS